MFVGVRYRPTIIVLRKAVTVNHSYCENSEIKTLELLLLLGVVEKTVATDERGRKRSTLFRLVWMWCCLLGRMNQSNNKVM